jgi:hypothetical protein
MPGMSELVSNGTVSFLFGHPQPDADGTLPFTYASQACPVMSLVPLLPR